VCGRYRRRSDKQRIAEAFQVRVNLDDLNLSAEDDITPGSFQPVVFTNDEGERSVELMYWGFTFPQRFTFNTRSDGILKTGLWKTSFEERRCIVPADSFFEWKRLHKKNNPKYEISIPGVNPLHWRASGACGRTRREIMFLLSPSSRASLMRPWRRSTIDSR
jgi:putative SOS response-associated peptidase YedK